MKVRKHLSIVLGIGMATCGTGVTHADMPELGLSDHLRVCADGNNLPYSNEAGEGFENRIAEMIADEMEVPVSYVYSPQIMGFVRNTLDTRMCDVMIGVTAGYGFVQNTTAYYRSVYSLVVPADSELEATSLKSPALEGRRIGVVADTPPLIPLRNAGAELANYPLQVDTRVRAPVRDAIEDVASGETEGAVIWGPLAGYYAAQQDPPLKVIPLVDDGDSDVQLDYRITMGVRHGERQWRDWLNDFIERRQGDIHAVLAEFHVPLLDEHGQLIHIDPMTEGDDS